MFELNQILHFLQSFLKINQDRKNEVENLFCYAFKKEKVWFYANYKNKISLFKNFFYILKFFYFLINLKIGKPFAYIILQKEFYSRNFIINKNTLIPRPETEGVIDIALEFLKNKFNNEVQISNNILSLESNNKHFENQVILNNNIFENHFTSEEKKITVLDLCCGSGCIGITLFLEVHKFIRELIFIDISKKALKITSKNIKKLIKNFDNIKILQSDLFQKVKNKTFDLILANPPYILPEEFESLDQHIKKFEPRVALVCENKFFFYNNFFKNINLALSENGIAIIEIGPKILDLCINFCKKFNLNYKVKKDLNNLDRYLILSKNLTKNF